MLEAMFRHSSFYHKDDYVNPQNLVKEIENATNKPFHELKRYVDVCNINLSLDNVVDYLENLQHEILVHNTIKDKAQLLQFAPFTLHAYQRVSDIYRNKTMLLLNVIRRIAARDTEPIHYLLENLDIKLNDVGEILSSDTKRLLLPMFDNLQDLEMATAAGNDLDTYLKRPPSFEIPVQTLQSQDPQQPTPRGTVPLSEAQRALLLAKVKLHTFQAPSVAVLKHPLIKSTSKTVAMTK